VPWGLIRLVLRTVCPPEPAAATVTVSELAPRFAIVKVTGPAPTEAGETDTRASVIATLRLTGTGGRVWLAKCEEPQAQRETAVAPAAATHVQRWDTASRG
jgi:hypothetical protein